MITWEGLCIVASSLAVASGWLVAVEVWLRWRQDARSLADAREQASVLAGHLARTRDRLAAVAAVADGVPALREERDEMLAELEAKHGRDS
jgi:hypothetical protein